MKNKGFTLVEIIVCLVLITLIGTISVISINSSNKKEKEEAKLISTVTNAANVYYSMNNALKQKLKDNYGYLVVSIEDLKNNGYLDKNYIVPNSDDKDYSKMVIVERDISNGFRLLSNENNDDEIGYIDYIYPYEENVPFIINLEDLTIENFEVSYFNCKTSGLTDGKLKYLDENYQIHSTDDFGCETYSYNNENPLNLSEGNKVNRILNNNSNKSAQYSIKYYLNNNNEINEIYNIRNLIVNPEPKIKLYLNNGNGTNIEYKENNIYYFNSNVDLSVKDTNQNVHHENLKFSIDSEEMETKTLKLNSDEEEMYKTFNGEYSYTLCGVITDTCKNFSNMKYNNITIDRENPSIEKTDYINQEITIKDNGSGIKLYKIDDKKYNSGFSTEPSQSITIKPNKKTFKLYMEDNAGNSIERVTSLKNPININVTKNNDISTFNVIVESTMDNVKINSVQVQYSFDTEFLEDVKRYGYVKNDIKSSEMKEVMKKICSTKVSESHSERYYCNGFTNNFLYESEYNNEGRNEIINEDSYNSNKTTFNQTFDMKTALNNCGSSDFCKRFISFESDILKGLRVNYHIKVEYEKNGRLETQEKEFLIKLNINNSHKLGEDNDRGRRFHLVGVNNSGDLLFYASVYNSGTTNYEFSLYNNKENTIKEIANLNDYSRWGRYWDSNVSIISYDENEIRLFSCITNKHGTKRKNTWFSGTNYFYTYNIKDNFLSKKSIATKWESKCDSYYPTGDNMENNFIRFRNDNDYEFLDWLLKKSQGRYGWDYANTTNFSKYYIYNDFDRVIPSYDRTSKNILIREYYEKNDYYYILNYKTGVTIEQK